MSFVAQIMCQAVHSMVQIALKRQGAAHLTLINWTTLVGPDVEGVVSKLRETEDLLEAVEAEKESAEAQVRYNAFWKWLLVPFTLRYKILHF